MTSAGSPMASSWPNLATMFFEQAARLGDAPWLWAKRDGVYRALTWRGAAERVGRLARGLRAIGVGPGDRVALVSENRPEWALADLAIMAAGGITVPAYTTNTIADHRHLLGDSGARVAIVSTAKLAERVFAAAADTSSVEVLVRIEASGPVPEGRRLVTWDGLAELGSRADGDPLAWARSLRRDDLACLIYTSGTGGAPKGVMLSHGAVLHNLAGARALFRTIGLEDEVFLSFLPLSHAYEHTAGLMFPCSIGAQIYFAESAGELSRNFLEARPTVVTCVPRLYEILRERILQQVHKASGVKRGLFESALAIGRRRHAAPGRLGLVDRLVDPVLDRLVRAKVRARFGGRLKAFVSGGAPLNPEVGLFFLALGVRVLQGYGQTEAAPVISVNLPERNKIETVGPPLDGVEVKIADDGEILVRGELVMKGYWRNAEATRQTLVDGWLHTGDLGHLDADGHLVITDRKKDIIVNSGGDNVAPQRVEGVLALEPEIAQAMVFGDRRPHLVALLVPEAEALKTSGIDARDAESVRRALGAAVERANAKLSVVEKVKRFAVADETFSVDNGLMTATLKVRRHAVLARYRERIEGLYA
ncbi:MAG: long-chain fatty acid--CoA ligase [Alphaproteobacteria bacterium]